LWLGTYTVTEDTAPAGYEKADPQTGVVVASSTKVTVTFVNTSREFRKEFTDPMVWVGPESEDWMDLADWHLANTPDATGEEDWVPVGLPVKWTVTFYVPNNTEDDWTDVVLRDRFGAELDAYGEKYFLNDASYPMPLEIPKITKDPPYVAPGVHFHYSKAQKMAQLRITWYIGELNSGGTETLSFDVVTRLNPGGKKDKDTGLREGKQEYTSPGLHFMNSGANLKWIVNDHQESMSTPPWPVMAGDTFGAIVGFVNDCEGNPVPGAAVELWGLGETATADEHGFYYFEVLPDDYVVEFYDLMAESVSVAGGEIKWVNFTYEIDLTRSGTATAGLSSTQSYVGDESAHLMTPVFTGPGADEGRIEICLPDGTTLGDIDSISWWVWAVTGYPPHVDIVLDGVPTAESMLTAEFAYNNVSAPASWSTTYSKWLETFETTSGDGFGEIDDSTILWVTKLGAGILDAPSSTLGQWKTSTVDSDPDGELPSTSISSSTPVLRLEIEIDNWIVQSEVYVDDIAIDLGP